MAAYASKCFSADVPEGVVWLPVSADGFLHFLPNDKSKIKHVADKHGLRNDYFRNMLGLNGHGKPYRTEHEHWQLVCNTQWLKHVASGVIVVVVGGPTHFFKSQASICESAGLADDALMFSSIQTLERLLADVRAAWT